MGDETPSEPRPKHGRPVPVGGFPGDPEPAAAETDAPEHAEDGRSPARSWMGEEAPPAEPERSRAARYSGDLLVALLAAALAAATFLPWYKTVVPAGATGVKSIGASGWATGTWGPVIFFLCLASVALIGLRRLGVKVSLPVEEPLVHEAVGWVSVIGVVIKSRAIPDFSAFAQETRSLGIWVALGAAFVLAILAGRMSPRASVVLLPGWYRGTAGVTGAAVLLIAIGGGVGLGFVNDAGGVSAPKVERPSEVKADIAPKGTLHRCARGFPIPAGFTIDESSSRKAGNFEVCIVTLSSKQDVKKLNPVVQSALKKAGWKFNVIAATDVLVQLELKAPSCGTVFLSPPRTFTPPSPGASPSPKSSSTGGANLTVSLIDCSLIPKAPPGSP